MVYLSSIQSPIPNIPLATCTISDTSFIYITIIHVLFEVEYHDNECMNINLYAIRSSRTIYSPEFSSCYLSPSGKNDLQVTF